ncbi:MAG: hypothetical protein COW26_03700 [Nitrosopumilales archaeon CG15_BIG_FIL_POST_REV_8_21_14_020_33_23]|nr:MAG: hypothetical protein COV65_05835 [Nitrosopumilales archaeon CG11_big_fil_rev_8_21_14_0_20_33_24]PIW35575.1 MAG: hypothetical protein COW26_03700 [Nitrosopumilales archaeon CG15_BIG_FIL_POST_REV_8_21_14_020_33_23]PIY88266.1 MAG: hypothetical protein COY74_09180 [Nitrosopumilales archaeon CG_4_10_14_0_8_um_filter_34_8]PJB98914.1 MAG: hypothetical protein CO079_01175 [Nitrosopumilales archaeon CG_4_9_14_0_8_um_filter_34_10]
MEHILFFDGDSKRISWVIQTDNSIVEQKREHAEIYLDKVTNQQSKYIGLHIGIFWGIGTFIIKNEDIVKITTDDKTVYDHLISNHKSNDEFIEKRTFFIRQLIEQRKLKIKYELVESNRNLAAKKI